jgi:hypothetical protein
MSVTTQTHSRSDSLATWSGASSCGAVRDVDRLAATALHSLPVPVADYPIVRRTIPATL